MIKKAWEYTKDKAKRVWAWTKRQAKKIGLILGIGAIALAATVNAPVEPQSLEVALRGKSYEQRVVMKSRAWVEVGPITKIARRNYHVQVTSIKEIDNGVEVLARVWTKGNKQIGFGKEGTVDLERFVIINPPVLVPDKNGDIVRTSEEFDNGYISVRKYREDPEEAILQVIEHIVYVKSQKFSDEKIIKGRIGNTTTAIFPDAATGGDTVDGDLRTNVSSATFAAHRDTAQTCDGSFLDNKLNSGLSTSPNYIGYRTSTTGNQFTGLARFMATFDVSALTGDTVSSSTLSLYGNNKWDTNSDNPDYNWYSVSPASDNVLVKEDYNKTNFGTTTFATAISNTNFNTSAYNDWSMSADGITALQAAADGDGIFRTGLRDETYDADGVDPTHGGGSNLVERIMFETADYTGTTRDTKLIVEHGAAAARRIIIIN